MVTFSIGTIPGGSGSSMSFNIPINDDDCVEMDETFTVSASTDEDTIARFPATSTTVTITSEDG